MTLQGDIAANGKHINGLGMTDYSLPSAIDVVAGTGVPSSSVSGSAGKTLIVVRGSGGAVTITANPAIANGTEGQVITLIGASDSNTLTINDGNGIQLNGAAKVVLGLGDCISFVYYSGDWREVNRGKLLYDASGNTVLTIDSTTNSKYFEIQNSDGDRIFQLTGGGDSFMDFRIHNSPFNECNNGSLEHWESGLPWAWGSSGSITVTQESGVSNKRLGNYSAKLDFAGSGAAFFQWTSRFCNEGINMTTAWAVKKSAGSADIRIAWYNTNTGTVYEEVSISETAGYKVIDWGGDWFRYLLTGAFSDTGDTLGVKIYQVGAGTATCYVDEIQIHEGDGEYAWTDQAIVVGQDQSITSTKLMREDKKIEFRNSNNYIHSTSTNALKIQSQNIEMGGNYITFNLSTRFRNSSQTANFTAGTSNTYFCNATSGNITATLPAAADGQRYTFVKTDSSVNTVTIDGNGSETINGSLTQVLSAQYDRLTIEAEGSVWYIISN